jgi:putative transport protein
MNWIVDILWNNTVAHTVLLLAVVIAAGVLLGKIKIIGVSLGMTMVLFVGIAVSHFGFQVEHSILHFIREFGLILFVYAVGLQVGPGFFSSFKKGGIQLNLLATGVVFLGVLITLTIYFISDIPITTMVGILSGAVTNTPGLGAAQEAYSTMTGAGEPTIALGYAVAYPLGVVGIIFSMIFIRYIFRVKFNKENEQIAAREGKETHSATPISLIVKNPAIFNRSIAELSALLEHREFVISRILYKETSRIEIATGSSILHEDDKIFVITTEHDAETIKVFIGQEIQMDRKQWIPADTQFISRRIVITKPELNGKRLGDLQLRRLHGINITRINRSGLDLVATQGLTLQIGDRLTVVGSDAAIHKVEEVLGNSLKQLDEPNLATLFIGIALGVLLGSIPFAFPGIPQPIKLGLAGGPLIVAILISVFGTKFKLVTYTTSSANLMLREIGICLFLACVGLGAGEQFVETIIHGGGLSWIGIGFIITVVPLVIVGIIARRFFRLDYFTLMGLLAGSTTDPPALSYASATAGNDAPSISYASIYPLTMFLRVMTAQLLILIFAG